MAYGNYKVRMNSAWFEIPAWIRQSPDFLTLSEEAIGDLRKRRTWLEWKILRQYQALFDEGIKLLKELAYRIHFAPNLLNLINISMNTRIMGEAAARRGDLAAVDLCLKFFNTYIRSSVNVKDVRTVYNVLFQYRMLAECICNIIFSNLRHQSPTCSHLINFSLLK